MWIAVSGCARPDREAIGAILDQARHEDLKHDALRREEQSYQKIREAVRQGALRKGTAAEEFVRDYGRPVVEIGKKDGASKWLYKPASGSWFDSPRVAVYFDAAGKVSRWRCVPEGAC